MSVGPIPVTSNPDLVKKLQDLHLPFQCDVVLSKNKSLPTDQAVNSLIIRFFESGKYKNLSVANQITSLVVDSNLKVIFPTNQQPLPEGVTWKGTLTPFHEAMKFIKGENEVDLEKIGKSLCDILKERDLLVK